MGVAKREKERLDHLVELGLSLCEEIGVLEQCGDHPGSYCEGNVSLEDGYAIATNRWKQGLVQGFRTRIEMTDAMKKAAEQFPSSECMSCENWKDG